MKKLDPVFGCLMILGGVGHGIGSYLVYRSDHMTLRWAWSASFAMFLLGALNLLRVGRGSDGALAAVCLSGCVVQAGIVTWFGVLIQNMLDFRPLVNLIVAVVLALFSIRTLVQSARKRERVQPNAATTRAQQV